MKRGWFLRAVYLRGVLNTRADTLSRSGPIQTEWELDQASFHWLSQLTSIPLQVDLCATTANVKLSAFVAPAPMRGAVGVDCLLVDWNQWNVVYIFPLYP